METIRGQWNRALNELLVVVPLVFYSRKWITLQMIRASFLRIESFLFTAHNRTDQAVRIKPCPLTDGDNRPPRLHTGEM